MINIVGVRFDQTNKIYYFDSVDYECKEGDGIIVETVRGIKYGYVKVATHPIDENTMSFGLKPIIRLATEEDKIQNRKNTEDALSAIEVFNEKVKYRNLEMNLVEVEYSFDRSKLIFYFTSEGRVDFRKLVKDLASVFHVRIELRQIGVRDVARKLSGYGCCGRKLCCSSWLGEFHQVSIKMAKDQNLSLNPSKISGVCGRLFCCLSYEQPTYEGLIQSMPSIGSKVKTTDGTGFVVETDLLKSQVKVQFKNKKDDSIKYVKYDLSDIKILNKLPEET